MSWLRRLLRREGMERDLNKELGYDVERRVAELIAQGVDRQEAARRVRLEFGGMDQVKEECRDARGTRWLLDFWQDCRYGMRVLRRNPGFTAIAILSLALGTGANTAVFQLLDAVRLRPLPVENPQELAEITIDGGTGGFGRNFRSGSLSNPLWEQIRANQEPFRGVFAWAPGGLTLGEGESRHSVDVNWMSGEAFAVLGLNPVRGRLLNAEDDQPGCAGSAVLSHGFWQREYGGDDSVIGSEIRLAGHPMKVVGVSPPEYFGIEVGQKFDVAVPLCAMDLLAPGRLDASDNFWILVLGRLKPDWTVERAASYLGASSVGWFEASAPNNYSATLMEVWNGFRLTAEASPNGVSELRDDYESSLWLLLGITGLVLLIACANLANLTLARTLARGREVATRMAIGASRRRVVSQLFAESALLGVVGAAIGVVLAQVLSRALVQFLSSEGNVIDLDLPMDWRVAGFLIVVALTACLFFGLSTALYATRSGAMAAAGSNARGSTAGRNHFSFQRLLIGGQVSVSLVLVVASLLFVRSFQNLVTTDAGFRQEGVVFSEFDLPTDLTAEALGQMKQRLLAEVRAIPGMEAAAISMHIPLSGSSWSLSVQMPSSEQEITSRFNWVSPGYFETMEIPLLGGRDFEEFDTSEGRQVLLVNQQFVREYFGGGDPIGKTVRSMEEPGYPETVYEVIGLVRDTKYADLREDRPTIAYAPAMQDPRQRTPGMNIVTRSAMPTATVTALVRQAAGHVSAGIVNPFTFAVREEALERLSRERMLAWLAGFFGVLAVVLVAVGLYGIVSYMVSTRRREIGIRMALGADARSVVGMVVGQAAWLTLVGCLVGVLGGLVVTRVADGLLFGIAPSDPVTFGVAIVVLLAVALGAAYIPGRAAARTNPVETLRAE